MTKKIIPVGAKRRSTLTAQTLAFAINVAVKDWPGRCHEIAGLMLAAGEEGILSVSGTLRYGMWLGPSHDDGHFKGRSITHHGWIEREAAKPCPSCGGRFNIEGPCCDSNKSMPAVVIDPTRWVFEHVKPYIFEGSDAEGYYDVAGNRLQGALMRPYPVQPEVWHIGLPERDVTIEANAKVLIRLATLIHSSSGLAVEIKKGESLTLPLRGMSWLANLPVDHLGEHAKAFYLALQKADLDGFIPQDNRELVMGDGYYGKKEAVKARVQKGRRK